MEKLIEMAKDLGGQIAAHERATLMLKAQKALQADSESCELVEQFQKHAEKVRSLEQSNQPVEVADKHKLEELENKMSSNDKIREFSKRQADYVEMMRKIWDTIHGEISGQQ